MPDISAQLQDQINVSKNAYAIPDFFVPMLMPGHKTGTPSVLFQKLSPELGEELKNRFAGAKLEVGFLFMSNRLLSCFEFAK